MSTSKLLMIPGPIEFHPKVIEALGKPTLSHTDPAFIESFGNALYLMRQVWLEPTGQPFVVAGSGTLAMDMAACNLIEAGDRALVVSSGYFGQRYADILKRYGAEVTILEAELGEVVTPEEVDAALSKDNYKVMTFTHVDTSTAVLMDAQAMGFLGHKHNVLTILDGVCSVAGEEIRQSEWGLDVVITASQKAIGVPPGLALMVASQRAIKAWNSRKTPVGNYYCDWSNWWPIMQAYENGNPSYFGTPPVNLIQALEVSLELMLEEGMNARFERHRKLAAEFRKAMTDMGLKIIPKSEAIAANTLTAPYYPEGINGGEFIGKVNQEGVVIAGGLLGTIRNQYFRVGHMGIVSQEDIDTTVKAIKVALGK